MVPLYFKEETSLRILVTGAKGMVGTALVNNLKNIRDGKIEPGLLSILMKSMNMTEILL